MLAHIWGRGKGKFCLSSSDEQNIFCLYKERFFWLFTHCICLIDLQKPHFPSFPFYAPFFFPLSPLITSFLQLYTNLTCIFSSNSVPFSFIRLFFHALSRSRCFCFLLCFTFFHNLSHASMICAIMCLSVWDNNGSSSPGNHGWTGVPDNTPVFSAY